MSRHHDLVHLRRHYIEKIDDLHSHSQYTEDFVGFAETLELVATFTTSDQAFALHGVEHININFTNSESRRAFSGWHEVCHKIIGTPGCGIDGVSIRDDILEGCGYNDKSAYEVEEEWCNLGASHFLFPRPTVESVRHMGFVPTQAIELVRLRGGSVSAASRKVASLHDQEAFVYLVRKDGFVVDAFSINSQLRGVRGGYYIDAKHPILHPNESTTIDFMYTYVPFKNGNQNMKFNAAVARDSLGRHLIFFTRMKPAAQASDQPGLFGSPSSL
jgi:Zn-dependent peptidase ImmA (M78 family)